MRAATGVALPPFPAWAGAGAEDGSETGSAAGWTGPPLPAEEGASAPAAIRQRIEPTGTVSSDWTRISSIVPATGEGTSASTLSVEISTRGSSTATVSPGPTRHSSTVPSATESPISGKATSTTSPEPEAEAEAAGRSASGSAGASSSAGESPLSISPSTAPTCTVESGSARIFTRVPATGAGTSASTLSVEISTRGSSAST